MKRDRDYWTPVFEMFCRDYPDLAEKTIDWYPSAQYEVTVKLRDDRRYVYNMFTNRAYVNYDPNDDGDLDDKEWQRKFSLKLVEKLNIMCITQQQLSEMTGISQVAISKYINCKAIPSCTNMRKIARALKCSTGEFMNE